MGKKQKRKGYRIEYNLVKQLRQLGLDAHRVPLSGADSHYKGDVVVEGFKGEVKGRKDAFAQIYKWIENADVLFIKADRKPYLVVMRLQLFAALLKILKGGETHGHSTEGDEDSS